MKTNQMAFARRSIAAATHAALMSLALAGVAHAADEADPAVTALTTPASSVEVGVQHVSEDSYKFGEYNGDRTKGYLLNGGFDLRGGGTWDSGDATRWRLFGRNLGLDNRSLGGEYGEQGKYRLTFGFDELYRARSDSYNSPYMGIGSNHLTLSSNWPIATYVPGPTNGVAQASSYGNAKNLSAAELGDFHTVDLHTERRKTSLGLIANASSRWDLRLSTDIEEKDGLKPTGALIDLTTPTSGDRSVILPEPIHFRTVQLNASAAYTEEKYYFRAAYYGSKFSNAVKSLSFMDPYQQPGAYGAGAGVLSSGVLGTAPDNEFHQFNLSGGYDFTRSTRLAVTAVYGVGKQDQTYLSADPSNSATYALPQASLGGEVDVHTYTAKLTSHPLPRLNIAVNAKLDERINKTAVNTYNMPDAEGDLGSLDTRSNTPFSKKVRQFDFDADYRLARGQWLKFGYSNQDIDRWCNGTWFACSDAGQTKENSTKLEYRTSMTESLSGRLGWTHSRRTADGYNPDANILASLPQSAALSTLVGQVEGMGTTMWGPMSGAVVAGSGSSAAAATAAANLAYPTGVAARNFGGLSSAVNIGGTYYVYLLDSAIGKSTTTGGVAPWIPTGMERYNLADRTRNKIRSSINYAVTDSFTVQAAVDYNKDTFTNTSFGLQHTSSAGYDVDANYIVSEDVSTDLFVTREDGKQYSTGVATSSNSVSTNALAQGANTVWMLGNTAAACSYSTVFQKNLNAKVDPCLDWSADIHDTATTAGASFQVRNLARHRLNVGGNLLFTRARTTQGFTGGAYATPIGTGLSSNNAAVYYPAAPTPDVTTDTWSLGVNGQYELSKTSWLRVNYLFEHMKVQDYGYNGYALGSMVTVLPTFETAPTFGISVVGVTYLYKFY